jgi:hypothetical protein
MGTKEFRLLPPDPVRGQSRFRAWRARRTAGERIRRPLWVLAILLVKVPWDQSHVGTPTAGPGRARSAAPG